MQSEIGSISYTLQTQVLSHMTEIKRAMISCCLPYLIWTQTSEDKHSLEFIQSILEFSRQLLVGWVLTVINTLPLVLVTQELLSYI